jgi:Flp pilus assembly protein TadD
MNRIAINIAASTLALSLGTAVCLSETAVARQESRRSGSPQEALELHTQAIRSVQQGRIAEALTAIERAVELAPRDAGYRLMLADVYLKSGRFEAARVTYADVLELDPAHVRAGISFALMQIAGGRPQAAVAQLDNLAGRAPAADVGLAYALAGYPERAVQLLEPAARQHDATPRLRQNLALSYALSGDWQRARAIAAQDISPAELPRRMEQWASMARPGAQSAQIASLLGVSPVADPGQPVRLALIQPAAEPGQPAPVQFAEAAPVEAPIFAASAPVEAPVETAVVEPDYNAAETAASEPAWWPAPATQVQPVQAVAQVPQLPVAQPVAPDEVEVRFAAAAETLVRPTPAVIRTAAATRPSAPTFRPAPAPRARTTPNGRFVVQIGAFSNEGNAERAWQQAERSYGLGTHQPTTTTTDTR